MTPSFYNWNMRSGDASAYTVLVALVNFKGSEFVKVRQLIARAVGNAPIIRQHRGSRSARKCSSSNVTFVVLQPP